MNGKFSDVVFYVTCVRSMYGALRYGTLRINTYGSTVHYDTLQFLTLRYVRVENGHKC